jgi:hypothetical protein
MTQKTYFKTDDCLIHLVDPLVGDSTICGDCVSEQWDVKSPDKGLRKRGPVTCPDCAALIRLCHEIKPHQLQDQ